MDNKEYKWLINRLRHGRMAADDIADAATAIETLLAEREVLIKNLKEFCDDTGDGCHLCKHMPCTERYGRCIGWQWRGLTPSDREKEE